METKELRELTVAELQKKAAELRRELLTLRIQRANQQLKNLLKLREVRRAIARVLTIIQEKGAK
ncbi:MAG: 50S ribosomal protein L29 [Candidatus Margulisiibacteriota bacterium]